MVSSAGRLFRSSRELFRGGSRNETIGWPGRKHGLASNCRHLHRTEVAVSRTKPARIAADPLTVKILGFDRVKNQIRERSRRFFGSSLYSWRRVYCVKQHRPKSASWLSQFPIA
jgi:hypothetical protein